MAKPFRGIQGILFSLCGYKILGGTRNHSARTRNAECGIPQWGRKRIEYCKKGISDYYNREISDYYNMEISDYYKKKYLIIIQRKYLIIIRRK